MTKSDNKYPVIKEYKKGNSRTYTGDMKTLHKSWFKCPFSSKMALASGVVSCEDDLAQAFAAGINHVIVLFYADWCGHCKRMKDDLNDTVASLVDAKDVLICSIESEESNSLSSGVRGFPTIKKWSKSADAPVTFEGDRNMASLMEFCVQ